MAPDRPAPPEELKSFLEFGLKDDQLLIGADADAHHSVWGVSGINDRGESLLDFILFTNLYIGTHLRRSFLVKRARYNACKGTEYLVSEWRVLKTPPFSDHRYIQFRYDFKSTPKVTVYRNPRKTNWEKFTRTVTSKLATSPGVVKSVKIVETSLETLSRELLHAYHASCPTSRTKKNQNQLKCDDRQWTEGSEEALTALMKSHFPGCTDVLDASTHQDIATSEERPPNDLVTPREINWAIDSFAGYKAPGLDGIFPAMLQVIKERITYIKYTRAISQSNKEPLGLSSSQKRESAVTQAPRITGR